MNGTTVTPPRRNAAAANPAGMPLWAGPVELVPGELVPGVVFVGASDALGRVTALVDTLVAELAGLSLAGAGRDVLRSLVAALGRVRAGADAAEARAVTALERLGDDGVEVLRRNAGSSQREAQRRKRRAEALAEMPNVAGALAAGDISAEHAEALARAAAATSHEAVDRDADLLAQVAGVPADRAGRQIQAWTQRNQDPADLHEQHLRQRRRRRLNFGDGDDGMLMAHAAFDRVLGAQFRSLINGIADRIWRAEGGRDNPDSRSAEQRRLDALAIAVGLEPEPAAGARGSAAGGGSSANGRNESPPGAQEPSRPDRATRHGGTASNRRTAHDRETQEPSGAGRTARHGGTERDRRAAGGRAEPNAPAGAAGRGSASGRGDVAIDDRVDGPGMSARRDGGAGCTAPPRPQPQPQPQPTVPRHQPVPPRPQPVPPRHQIVIVASADVVTGKDPQGRCEIPGIGPIPPSSASPAELFGVLFSGDGDPLWHGRGERTATDAQRRDCSPGMASPAPSRPAASPTTCPVGQTRRRPHRHRQSRAVRHLSPSPGALTGSTRLMGIGCRGLSVSGAADAMRVAALV